MDGRKTEAHRSASRERMKRQRSDPTRSHFGFHIGDRVRVKMDYLQIDLRGKPGVVVDMPLALGREWIEVKLDDRERAFKWHHSYFEHDASGQGAPDK